MVKVKNDIARPIILSAAIMKGYKTKDVARMADINISTLYQRFESPSGFRLEELRKLTDILSLTDEQIIEIVRNKQK